MQASDRFNINSQLEHLQTKYVGTGHPDVHRFEWAVNIKRDSFASYVGHHATLSYFALAENESLGRSRYNFLQNMLSPCGPPPDKDEEEDTAPAPSADVAMPPVPSVAHPPDPQHAAPPPPPPPPPPM